MPLFGRPNIEKLKQERDVKGLIKALGHRDPEIRRHVTDALVELEEPRAVEPLIGILKNAQRDHWAAARVYRGADAGLAPYAAVAERVKRENIRNLTEALERIGGPDAERALAEYRAPDIQKLKERGDFEGLFQTLYHEDEATRCNALDALGALGDQRAVPNVVYSLKDEYEPFGVHEAAASALVRIGGRKAERALAEYRPRATTAVAPSTCARCGKSLARTYRFYFGTKTGRRYFQYGREVSLEELHGSAAHEVRTTYRIGGRNEVPVCASCVRKERVKGIALFVPAIVGAPLALATIDRSSADTDWLILAVIFGLISLYSAGWALSTLFQSDESVAIGLRKKALRAQGWDTFWTPSEYAMLQRQARIWPPGG